MTTAEPKPKERMTVHLPSELREQITHAAKDAGQCLSIWVERACAGYITKKEATK
jgi:predicted HicB family RNase H-like nuclease